jgi:hypothetical protein
MDDSERVDCSTCSTVKRVPGSWPGPVLKLGGVDQDTVKETMPVWCETSFSETTNGV